MCFHFSGQPAPRAVRQAAQAPTAVSLQTGSIHWMILVARGWLSRGAGRRGLCCSTTTVPRMPAIPRSISRRCRVVEMQMSSDHRWFRSCRARRLPLNGDGTARIFWYKCQGSYVRTNAIRTSHPSGIQVGGRPGRRRGRRKGAGLVADNASRRGRGIVLTCPRNLFLFLRRPHLRRIVRWPGDTAA